MLRYTLFQGNTGANWLRPSLADELFALGQPRPFPGNADKTQRFTVSGKCLPLRGPGEDDGAANSPDLCKPITLGHVNRASLGVSVADTASSSHIICGARAEVCLRCRHEGHALLD